jgi:sulfate adenylyltransferase
MWYPHLFKKLEKVRTEGKTMGNYLPKPHGGKLANRILEKTKREQILDEIDELPKIIVDKETINDIRNIAEGVFSPLEGFMEQRDYTYVIHKDRLANGTPWTIPIVLDASRNVRSYVSEGDDVILTEEAGQPLAVIHVSEIYSFDKKDTALHVFGTTDKSHPGVQKILKLEEFLLGGKIDMIDKPQNKHEKYHLNPTETRKIFEKKEWKTIAGFQTRNIPHLGHEYIQKTALTFVDGLFINPIIGKKKKGDFKDDVILTTYKTLIKNYFPAESTVFGILQTEMHYAGPKEAIFHAIIRKNYGCTHFIVGRDHAGVGDFYPPYASHEIFKQIPDLGIIPLFFPSVFLCNTCKTISNDKTCPHSQKCHHEISGSRMRQDILNGEVDDVTVRPEVAEILKTWKDPLV